MTEFDPDPTGIRESIIRATEVLKAQLETINVQKQIIENQRTTIAILEGYINNLEGK